MKLPIVTVASLLAGASAFAPRSCTSVGFVRAVAPSNTAPVLFMSSASPADFVKSEIESNDVMIFSKSFCPFCKKTKKLMQVLKIDAKVVELNEVDGGDAMQEALMELSGQRTVPNVFIKGEHLGGNDATQAAAKSGKLQEMLGI